MRRPSGRDHSGTEENSALGVGKNSDQMIGLLGGAELSTRACFQADESFIPSPIPQIVFLRAGVFQALGD